MSLPESTPSTDVRTCATFVDVANKTEITCKKVANKEEKAILKVRAKKTVKLLQVAKFLPRGFKLDCQYAPLIVAEVVDAIGLKYRRLSMLAKTKFYTE